MRVCGIEFAVEQFDDEVGLRSEEFPWLNMIGDTEGEAVAAIEASIVSRLRRQAEWADSSRARFEEYKKALGAIVDICDDLGYSR